MHVGAKVILSLFLLVSAISLLYYPFKVFVALQTTSFASETKAALSGEIAGFSLLFLVVFLLIWYIPEQVEQQPRQMADELTQKTEQVYCESCYYFDHSARAGARANCHNKEMNPKELACAVYLKGNSQK